MSFLPERHVNAAYSRRIKVQSSRFNVRNHAMSLNLEHGTLNDALDHTSVDPLSHE